MNTLALGELGEHAEGVITRLDQMSREVNRLYGNSDILGVMTQLVRTGNSVEAAVVALMAADRMTPEGRRSFTRSLQFQAVSFVG